ncbi:MAG: hypothetical protein GPI96_13510 [Microcystis aeruginosa BS13-02]|nr:hypothetical protein [Microcystis aeruginosa BS13-02]
MNKTILSNAIFMTFFLSTVSHGYTHNEASLPIRALEGDNCNRVVELIYQSEKLASNDSSTKVYFEGFLRRIGKDEDQTDGEFCEPATDRETLSIKIVIENNNEIKKIELRSEKPPRYMIFTPISFDIKNNYILARYYLANNWGSVNTGYFTYDLKSDKLSYIKACQEEELVEYRGFISSLEIAFKCSVYGQDLTETSFIYDIFNSSNGQVYRVRERIRIKHERFGEIVDSMSIIKRQVF